MKYIGKTDSLDLYMIEGLSPEQLIDRIQQFTDDIKQEGNAGKVLEACIEDGRDGWVLTFHVYE